MIDTKKILANLNTEGEQTVEEQIIRRLCAEVERHQWISVDERLPPIETPVWLLQEGRIRPMFVGCYTDTGDGLLWADCNGSEYWNGSEWECTEAEFDDYKIAAWMPLPNPPEESDE